MPTLKFMFTVRENLCGCWEGFEERAHKKSVYPRFLVSDDLTRDYSD